MTSDVEEIPEFSPDPPGYSSPPASEFPPNFSIDHDEQIYRPVGIRDHVTANGRNTKVIEWLTKCPQCSKEFTVITGMRFAGPRRRCDDCKAPGRPVHPLQRRRRVAGEIPRA